MGELGLLGIPWPEELGGAGLDLLSYMIVIHEMAKVDASHGITISAHTTLGTSPIVNFGTARAEGALRSAARVRASARRIRPHRAERGQRCRRHAHDGGSKERPATSSTDRKLFITHGGVGEIFVVTAVTDPEAGTKGITPSS